MPNGRARRVEEGASNIRSSVAGGGAALDFAALAGLWGQADKGGDDLASVWRTPP